jgi:hypothetical protein
MVGATVAAAAERGTDMRLILSLIALALVAGCGDKKQEPAAGSGSAAVAAPRPEPKPEPKKAEAPAAPATFQKPVLEALQKAGLAVGDFEPTAAKPYNARACVRGEVSKLDVMACQYESEQAAEQAKSSLEQFVGGAGTGAVRRAANVALSVADRAKIDPRGQLVDKVLKTFAGQPPPAPAPAKPAAPAPVPTPAPAPPH